MKIYIDVGATGNVKLLIRSGRATDAVCAEHWESIVKQNGKMQGNQSDYDLLLKEYKAYNRLLRDHNGITAHLTILKYTIRWESIQYVRSKGYKLDTTNRHTFKGSLFAAIYKSNNIITKLTSKKNELLKIVEDLKKSDGHRETFESIMAALSFNLGYTVSDDITLSRYNEYIKLIEKKHRALKSAKEKIYGG